MAKPWVAESNRRRATHRMTGTPEYRAWMHMKNRCLDNTNPQYKDYGGRGISVCEAWLASFQQFYADLGPRPNGCSLDRINNNGNYEPANCRWATKIQQANNRTDNRFITYNNETLTLQQWSERLDMPHLWSRLARGWSMDQAVKTPYIRRKSNAAKS